MDVQITPGEEGFFAVGSGYENSDPSGVPSNVQAAGRCVSGAALVCMLSVEGHGFRLQQSTAQRVCRLVIECEHRTQHLPAHKSSNSV